jgi:hypothetical protein
MLHVVELAALALAVANALALLVLIYRRVRLGILDRRRERLEAEVTPLALALLDGTAPPPLETRAQLALTAVLARYSRLVRGSARQHIAGYFAGSSAYEQAVREISSRRRWRRTAAAFALGDMAVGAAVPALLVALEDGHREVRAAAARSLGRLGAVDAVADLASALARVTVPRQVAATALLAIGDAALPHLAGLLASPDVQLRATAAELIGLLGGPAEAPLLIERLSDASAEVREQAAVALGRLGAESAESALVAALSDPIGFVRAAAAQALGAIGDRSAVPALLAIARGDSFEPAHTAAQAIGALDPVAAASATGSPHLDEVADVVRLRA